MRVDIEHFSSISIKYLRPKKIYTHANCDIIAN